MITEVEQLTAGKVKSIGSSVRFHGTPGGVKRAGPLLGQHSRDVLLDYGYGEAGIERLISIGVVSE